MSKKKATDDETVVEDAPILIGREGDEFETVTLEGGGAGGGVFRVTKPAPAVVVSHGSCYVLHDRETLVYHWQVP